MQRRDERAITVRSACLVIDGQRAETSRCRWWLNIAHIYSRRKKFITYRLPAAMRDENHGTRVFTGPT